jgi:hypothetical protein
MYLKASAPGFRVGADPAAVEDVVNRPIKCEALYSSVKIPC